MKDIDGRVKDRGKMEEGRKYKREDGRVKREETAEQGRKDRGKMEE